MMLYKIFQTTLFWVLFISISLFSQASYAQADDPVIVLSGVVVSGEDSYGIPGVHVYVKEAGIGTSSNGAGLFRIHVVPGDTVVFSHITYKTQKFIVPNTDEQALSILIDLATESTLLPMVEVFPFPSEEVFKEAFLALDLKDQREENMRENLSPERIARMASQMGMSAGANHRNFMNNQVNQVHNQFFAPTLSLLNPFAWSEFIKSIKRGDFKRKD